MFFKNKKSHKDIIKIIKKNFISHYDLKKPIPKNDVFLKQYKNILKAILNLEKELTYIEIIYSIKNKISNYGLFNDVETKLRKIPLIIYNNQEEEELIYEDYTNLLEKLLPDLVSKIKKEDLNNVFENVKKVISDNPPTQKNESIVDNKEEIKKYFESILLKESLAFLEKYPNLDYYKRVYKEVGVSDELIESISAKINKMYSREFNEKVGHGVSKRELEKHITANRISLVNYLNNLIKSGHSRREIKSLLENVGWNKDFVESI